MNIVHSKIALIFSSIVIASVSMLGSGLPAVWLQVQQTDAVQGFRWGEIGGIVTMLAVIVGAFNRYLFGKIKGELVIFKTSLVEELDRRYLTLQNHTIVQDSIDRDIRQLQDKQKDIQKELTDFKDKVLEHFLKPTL